MKTTAKLLLPVLALSASIICASAQEKKDEQNPDRRRGGDRGSFNMDEFRQRMAERLKTSLKVTDDEWAVISPLIEKVQTKMRDSASTRGFGGGAPGEPSLPCRVLADFKRPMTAAIPRPMLLWATSSFYQNANTNARSLTFVSVGPGFSRSPSAPKNG